MKTDLKITVNLRGLTADKADALRDAIGVAVETTVGEGNYEKGLAVVFRSARPIRDDASNRSSPEPEN